MLIYYRYNTVSERLLFEKGVYAIMYYILQCHNMYTTCTDTIFFKHKHVKHQACFYSVSHVRCCV